MYYIYNVSERKIETVTILGGRATRPIRGNKGDIAREIKTLKKTNRKANLVIMSESKAVAKGIIIPKIKIVA